MPEERIADSRHTYCDFLTFCLLVFWSFCPFVFLTCRRYDILTNCKHMKFPLFIAWRYLFAKKRHTAINILTMISVTGVAVGTMALVIVLSVFNGFEKLILSLFNAFHPDMEIRLVEGKTFSVDDLPLEEIENLPGVASYSEVLEESALIMYRERQHLVRIRGVDQAYSDITGIDTMVVEGEYLLRDNDRDYLLPGQGVAWVVNASIHDYLNPIDVYIPRRGRTVGLHPGQAFNSSGNFARGIFAVQAEYDMEYVIAPVRLMRRLLDYDDEVSSIMIRIEEGHNHNRVQEQLQHLAGTEFHVRNRLQQQEFLYRIMRSEKWAIFFILSFILIIASFNVIGSLTMLVIEKRRDISVLRSMGASKRLVKRIFLTEGMLISMAGALGGIFLGGMVSWLQMRYGLVRLHAEGAFIIDAYPVDVQIPDLLLVGATVFCVGMVASLIPLHNMWKKMDKPPGSV